MKSVKIQSNIWFTKGMNFLKKREANLRVFSQDIEEDLSNDALSTSNFLFKGI